MLLIEASPAGDEIELSDADLDSEPLTGGIVDLGEIAAQSMAVGLDPYPRAPGATAVDVVIDEETARRLANPFSVLGGKRH